MKMRTGNVLLGCQIGKQFQSRQWRDYKSCISNSCQLSYTPRGRPRHTRMVMSFVGTRKCCTRGVRLQCIGANFVPD